MTKEEMIAFLDAEAELGVRLIWTTILEFIEKNYVPRESLCIPIYLWISKDIPRNRVVLITNKVVESLKGLDYKAYSRYASQASFLPEVIIE